MGFSEKLQVVDGHGLDLDGNKRWVIAGIPVRAPLKPINTKNPLEIKEMSESNDDLEYCTSTTPTGEEARIPDRLMCPPAPRKRKATLKLCNYSSGVREFFAPPDLETVFIQRAN